MVISAWGEIFAELPGDFNSLRIPTAVVDLTMVRSLGAEVPLRKRIDVYPEL
jgi:hypothetical protein